MGLILSPGLARADRVQHALEARQRAADRVGGHGVAQAHVARLAEAGAAREHQVHVIYPLRSYMDITDVRSGALRPLGLIGLAFPDFFGNPVDHGPDEVTGRAADELLPADNLIPRHVIPFVLFGAHLADGALSEASRALTRELEIGLSAGNVWTIVRTLSDLADLELIQGHLGRAAGLCHKALQEAEQRLQEIVLQAENLFRYTPYRLHFSEAVGWDVTPAEAIAAWGTPAVLTTAQDQGIVATWEYPGHRVTLDFGRPRSPLPLGVPDGTAWLRTVRLTRQNNETTGRMTK